MKGKVNDGDLVTVAPCTPESLRVGDIVLVRVRGSDYLHLIKAVDGERFQIGNNRGGINGWVGGSGIFGKAVRVESGNAARQDEDGADSQSQAPRRAP